MAVAFFATAMKGENMIIIDKTEIQMTKYTEVSVGSTFLYRGIPYIKTNILDEDGIPKSVRLTNGNSWMFSEDDEVEVVEIKGYIERFRIEGEL